jgi:SH3-like domain-containing protein
VADSKGVRRVIRLGPAGSGLLRPVRQRWGQMRLVPTATRIVPALVLLALLFGTPSGTLAQAGRTTGLPVPRFVSLGADEVNLRFGPGDAYPIAWILTREGLPVEIVEEFDTWRKVRLHDGELGWIHGSLLSSRRTVLVADEIRALRQTPDPDARIVLRAEPGVIGQLLDCDGGWCRVEIDGRRGWLQRAEFWGVLADETLR